MINTFTIETCFGLQFAKKNLKYFTHRVTSHFGMCKIIYFSREMSFVFCLWQKHADASHKIKHVWPLVRHVGSSAKWYHYITLWMLSKAACLCCPCLCSATWESLKLKLWKLNIIHFCVRIHRKISICKLALCSLVVKYDRYEGSSTVKIEGYNLALVMNVNSITYMYYKRLIKMIVNCVISLQARNFVTLSISSVFQLYQSG